MKTFFQLSIFILFIGCNIPFFSQKGDNRSEVIAIVGNYTLTDTQLNNEMHRGASLESKYKYVREWVDRTLYANVAREAKMDKSELYIRKVEDFKRDLLSTMFRDSIEKSLDTIVVSESEMKSYYNRHRDSFLLLDDKIKVEIITVDNGKKAWEILGVLRPTNFHKLSKKHSITPTIPIDELTFTDRGDLDKSVRSYLFTIKKNGITPPRKIGGQYLMFHVLDKRLTGSPATYEEVKNLIHSKILSEKINSAIDKSITKLRNRDDYYFNRDYFSSIETSSNSGNEKGEDEKN
jgi:uncharacterized membrane protein YheB (UPF0754 family)